MPNDLSQLGASGAVVITVVIFLKFISDERKIREKSIEQMYRSVDKNTKASEKHIKAIATQVDASKKQREASHEVLIFMKKLNGKLEGAVVQKVAEQTVEHQTIKRGD
jgi:uncharacterized membrane protein